MTFRRNCARWGCGKEVPQDRVLRSTFCSSECRNEDKKGRRRAGHERFCPACGRSAKKPKQAEVTLKVTHPKNCDLCGGSTWVNLSGTRLNFGQFRFPIVKRCPNWRVEKLNLMCDQGGSGDQNRQSGEPLLEAAQSDDETYSNKTAVNDELGGLPSSVEATDGEPLLDGSDSFTLPPGCF